MAFDWLHYLELAEKLQKDLPAERSNYKDIHIATMRCIISRAYYAAYWTVRRYLKDKTGKDITGQERSHIEVIEEMKKLGKEPKSIGLQLQNLKARRIQADYNVKEIFTKEDSMSRVNVARDIIKRVNKLS